MKLRLALVATAFLLAAPAASAGVPQVEASAYLLVNGRTGEVLAGSHARERLPIASITKLMTVLVALDHARLDEVVAVSAGAAEIGESSIYLKPGDRLTVRELIEAALIQSANDAAVALAEHVGGGSRSAFVAMMNDEARELGLTDTHFQNPDGLDEPGHYSSARDVTRLARIAMRRPVVRHIVAETSAMIAGGRQLTTWNDLLSSFPGAFGVKTGHTSQAGWSEVAAARKPGVTIYATILGGETREGRNEDLAALLRWGLSRYRTVRVVSAERIYATAAVPFGKPPLQLVGNKRVLKIVRVARPLVERVVAPAVVSLPVRKGEQLGEVRIYSGSKLIARRPLVAARSISRPDFWGRVGWYSGQAAHHAWSWVT